MMSESKIDSKDNLGNIKTQMFDIDESFMTQQDFDQLMRITECVPYEHVDLGDAGEPNYVDVGRFMTDAERPVLVNKPFSDQALEILGQDHIVAAHREIIGSDEVFIRRMQVNIMKAGGFVGYHLDTDSNPDYEYAIILQMGEDFSGGEYVTYPEGEPECVFSPKSRSLIISNCAIPHEVKEVKNGHRKSLVYFLARNGGDNRRANVAG